MWMSVETTSSAVVGRTTGKRVCTAEPPDMGDESMLRARIQSAIVAVGVIVAICSGCGRSAKHRLVGKWQGTIEFKEEVVARKRAEVSKNPLAKAILEKLIQNFESGTIDVELKRDNSFNMTLRLGSLTKASHGTWQVISAAGRIVIIRLIDHAGKVEQCALQIVDRNTVTMDIVGKEGKDLAVFRCSRIKT
jgi:hypothetical protein